MTIYLDRDFYATTLADLLTQVQVAATEEWFLHLESEVWDTYRDLARADVKAGRTTPADHPDLSPGWFMEPLFDTTAVQAMWECKVMHEVFAKSAIFNPKGDK